MSDIEEKVSASSTDTDTVFGIKTDVENSKALAIMEKAAPSEKKKKKALVRKVSPISNAIKSISEKSSSSSRPNKLNELDAFLNESIQQAKQVKQPWNKLSRHDKINMLEDYAIRYLDENNLPTEEKQELKDYLISAMDKKRISKVKEIVYDKDKQVILSIPILTYNTSGKRFTLKRLDKRQPAIKSLTPKKNKPGTKGKMELENNKVELENNKVELENKKIMSTENYGGDINNDGKYC